MIDLALTSDSIGARAKHDPLLTRDALEDARRLYLGQANAKDPRASPLYDDLTDLPPVLLHVGADEILLDDARRYAHLLANSGPAAELHVWEAWCTSSPPTLSCCRPRAKHLPSPANSFGASARSLSDMLRLSDHHHSHGETT
jgi:epsilon-lactone hydrolase